MGRGVHNGKKHVSLIAEKIVKMLIGIYFVCCLGINISHTQGGRQIYFTCFYIQGRGTNFCTQGRGQKFYFEGGQTFSHKARGQKFYLEVMVAVAMIIMMLKKRGPKGPWKSSNRYTKSYCRQQLYTLISQHNYSFSGQT